MPEGDTIFRTARTLHRALAGKAITGFRSTFAMRMTPEFAATRWCGCARQADGSNRCAGRWARSCRSCVEKRPAERGCVQKPPRSIPNAQPRTHEPTPQSRLPLQQSQLELRLNLVCTSLRTGGAPHVAHPNMHGSSKTRAATSEWSGVRPANLVFRPAGT